MICDAYIDSQDPRGIDVAMMHQTTVKVDRFEALMPADRSAVRPVIQAHLRYQGHRFRVALVHGKSRRSGPSTARDDRPGSRLRFAHGRLLRQLAGRCRERSDPAGGDG